MLVPNIRKESLIIDKPQSIIGDISMSQLPQPCLKGDMIAIIIPKDEYFMDIKAYKINLHDV